MKVISTIIHMSSFLWTCIQFLFDVFSTVMSPKDVLIETEGEYHGYNAGIPIAIPIYTVLPYCVIAV